MKRLPETIRSSRIARAFVVVLTFHLTCLAWVFFRARSVSDAGAIVVQMLVPNGTHVNFPPTWLAYLLIGMVAVVATVVLSGRDLPRRVPGWAWGAAAAVMLFLTLVTWGDPTEFIYFQF